MLPANNSFAVLLHHNNYISYYQLLHLLLLRCNYMLHNTYCNAQTTPTSTSPSFFFNNFFFTFFNSNFIFYSRIHLAYNISFSFFTYNNVNMFI